MGLHKVLPDSELPPALTQPLIFGNPKQISASYDLEVKIKKLETEKAAVMAGTSKYYDVCIEYSGEQNIKVLAVSKFDAEEKAKDEACIDEADIEVDCVNAREIKPIKIVKK